MVNFFDDDRGVPSGPCRMLMNRQGDFIREMVSRTEETGKEYIANIVEITGNVGHTDMMEGTEESITSDVSARVNMDAISIASEIKDTPGGSITIDYKTHQVHTHPGGHTGLSLADMKSFADNLVTDRAPHDSELVATMTSDGILLGGVYAPNKLDEDSIAEIQSSLSLVNTERMMLTHEEKKMDLLTAFENAGLSFCSVTFPQRE